MVVDRVTVVMNDTFPMEVYIIGNAITQQPSFTAHKMCLLFIMSCVQGSICPAPFTEQHVAYSPMQVTRVIRERKNKLKTMHVYTR